MKTTSTIFLSITTALALCFTAIASEGPPPILNPSTHLSSSGVYSFFVNPTDLHGRGPADYRFSKNGATVWTNQFPFTLWDVCVANSGYIAGYAYSHGWRGFSEKGYQAGMGEFSVVILSPEGKIVTQDVYAREGSRFLHTPPSPLAQGMLIDEQARRLVLRIADPDVNRGMEQWWVYDLGGGKRSATLEPGTQMAGSKQRLAIIAARAVPATPLILVHWWKVDYPRLGGIFTLVDQAGKPVWMLTLDQDYNAPSDEAREDESQRLIWKDGGILAVGTNGVFDLHLVKDGLRVSYAVEQQAPDQWKVKRTGHAPYAWQRSTPQPATLPAFPLRKLGETTLAARGVGVKSQIRELVAFDFTPDGAICALRAGRDTQPGFLLLAQHGAVLKEMRLPIAKLPAQVRFSNPANIGGGRFVAAVSDQGAGGVAQFFLADFSNGTVKTITNATCPSVNAIAGFPDGSFAALTTRWMKYTMAHGLCLFDAKGKLMWSKEQGGYSGKPDELLSPEDLARCGTNKIAVLDNIRHTIQIFDAKGILERTIDLEKAWGRKPNYPTNIAPDVQAGFLVYDFNAQQPLLQLDAKGAILAASLPRFADGRPFRVMGGVKRSPQGDLWTSDGDSLFRLSTNSTVNLILGEAPTPSVLSAPDLVAVGPDDRVYIADRRTKALHVFDALGQRWGHCAPTAEDMTESSWISHIAVSADGNVYLSLGVCTKGSLHFNKDLRRAGWSNIAVDSVSQAWYFQPANDLCWVVGYNDVFLVRGLRDIVRRISRRSDGRWLEYPGKAAVAPDGSLAVLSRNQSRDLSVNTYGATGIARATFQIPGERYVSAVAYDGQRVYIRKEADVLIYGSNGDPLGAFALDSKGGAQKWTGPFLAAKGSELWFISKADFMIHRYAVPNAAGTQTPLPAQ